MQQDLKSDLTKQIIIDEAYKLFYQHGFKTTSIEKIMKATSLTKGAFYHHYKNKEELGLEVIAQKLEKRVYDSMISPLYQAGNPIKILESTFLNRIKSIPLHEKKHGCPMNNFINEIGDFETIYQTTLKNIIEKWKSALVHLIERGKADNTIHKTISSQAAAVYLISAFEGIRGIRKLYDNDEILDEYILGLSLYLKQLEP